MPNVVYLSSSFSPECVFAAIDGVVVGQYCEYMVDDRLVQRWVERSIYRPVRNHYTPIDWSGLKFDLSLSMPEEFEYVKVHGHEVPPFDPTNPSDREEMKRWKIRLDEFKDKK